MGDTGKGETGSSAKKVFPIFEKNFKPKPDPLKEIQTTLERQELHQQAKRRKCLLGKKEPPGLTQMILDAGQKEFGPVICGKCGMLYSPGDIEDEKEHQKAHSRIDNLFQLRLWKDANIVQDFPAEGVMIVSVDCKTAPKRILNSLKDFLAWLDSEVGASQDESGHKPTERIYLYMFKTKRKNILRIMGCAITEFLDQSKIICGSLHQETGTEEDCKAQIVLGLTRLWTDESFRKKHIASRLCDAIRISWGIPGMVLQKRQLGILEPSDDGRAFMKKYTENTGFLYTYNSSEVFVQV